MLVQLFCLFERERRIQSRLMYIAQYMEEHERGVEALSGAAVTASGILVLVLASRRLVQSRLDCTLSRTASVLIFRLLHFLLENSNHSRYFTLRLSCSYRTSLTSPTP